MNRNLRFEWAQIIQKLMSRTRIDQFTFFPLNLLGKSGRSPYKHLSLSAHGSSQL
jgi:hypothetical protein